MVAQPCRNGGTQGRRGLQGPRWRPSAALAVDEKTREYATTIGDFDPAEIDNGKRADSEPPFVLAVLPLLVVIVVNFAMSLVVLPRLDFSFLAKEVWGGTTIGAVAGIWSVILALGGMPDRRRRQLPALTGLAGNPGRRCQCLGLAATDGQQSRRLRRCGRGFAAFVAVRDAVLSFREGR